MVILGNCFNVNLIYPFICNTILKKECNIKRSKPVLSGKPSKLNPTPHIFTNEQTLVKMRALILNRSDFLKQASSNGTGIFIQNRRETPLFRADRCRGDESA
jgi:hypothetical protein